MGVPPSDRLRVSTTVPEHVLTQELDDTLVLLNLNTDIYFSLDDVGTRMWQAMEKAGTLAEATQDLAEFYDAPLETIAADLVDLAEELRDRGLLEFGD